MSIEGISLKNFSAPTHTETTETPQSRTRHAVFHSFLSNDIKQDSTKTIAHRKRTIELLKQHNIMSNALSTIWVNTDGCADHYRCATVLHLMSMLSQAFYVIIERGTSFIGHGRQVVDGLNSILKRFLIQLMSSVQISYAKVMTHRWLCTLEPVHLLLFWPVNFKNTCLLRHANMELLIKVNTKTGT